MSTLAVSTGGTSVEATSHVTVNVPGSDLAAVRRGDPERPCLVRDRQLGIVALDAASAVPNHDPVGGRPRDLRNLLGVVQGAAGEVERRWKNRFGDVDGLKTR